MEHDVFISYAHFDNKPLRPEDPNSGWVSKFYYVLDNFLTQWLGREAKIFRDTRDIDSNSYIWDTIEENLKKSNTFVPVVSPSYLNSQWCPKELRTYRQIDKALRVGNKSRIFKVFKQPINKNQIAEDLRDLFSEVLATNFFEEDQASGKTRIINVAYGDKWEQNFYQKIDFLAQEIAELLGEAQPQPAKAAENQTSAALAPFLGMTIYLTEPSPDLWKDYVEIRRDFVKRGATVLPSLDSLKPDKIEDYEPAMRAELNDCKLVVHFIGAGDVAYSESSPQSLIRLQMDLAAKYQDEIGYPRLILVPQTVAPTDENHRQFIEHLSETTSRNVDLLRTTLELKTEMERILTGKPKPAPAAETAPGESVPSVYILHDAQEDLESIKLLARKLFDSGCDIMLDSQTTGDLMKARKTYLINCDAAIVYWNQAPGYSVRALISEFQRIRDNGRDRDFLAKGVFIEGDSPEKEFFRTPETLLRSDSDLAAFVARLKNGGQD